MAEPAVINASPLIYLSRGGCFDLLQVTGDHVFVPESVANELRQRGEDDPAVSAMNRASWLSVVVDPPIPQLVQAWDLGRGESAVLAWALSHPGTEAIVDDMAARRCAALLSVPVRGTLGIILAAKQQHQRYTNYLRWLEWKR